MAEAGKSSGGTFAEGRGKILAAVVIGTFMVILDTTVINVAFPTLRAEFGAGLAASQWIVSVYVLALGIATPTAGFLGDRFGARRMYVIGLCTFVAGSMLAGFAPALWWLIAARALQAAGGGLATPLGSAFLFRTFPPEKQGIALGLFGVGLLVAPAVGPVLGGFLVDAGHWRWIFYINAPVGLLGALFAARVLPGDDEQQQTQADVWGLVTSVVAFGSLLYGASMASELGWGAAPTVAALVTGSIGLALLIWIDVARARDPLLEFRLYGNRIFLTASVVGYVSVLALFGAEFLLPLYLQTVRGLDALQTGLVLLPLAIAAGTMTPIAGRLYDRVGPRALVTVGFTLLSINTWQLSKLDASTSLGHIRLLMVLRGLALGLTVQSTFTTALGSVPRERVARGSSLVNGTRFVVQSIGVALLTTVLAASLSPATRALQQRVQTAAGVGGGRPGSATRPQESAGGQTSNNGASANGAANAGAPNAGGVRGLCVGSPSAASTSGDAMRRACTESLSGFERAYRVTFYAALAALVLGLLMPGWPGQWSGREGIREGGGSRPGDASSGGKAGRGGRRAATPGAPSATPAAAGH